MNYQKLRTNPRLAAALWAPLLWLLTAGLPASAEDNWSFDVTPYLWVASVDAETSVPQAPSSASSEFDTSISAGLMLAAQAHYRSFGVFADFAWLRLDTDAVSPGPAFSSGNLESDFIHSTVALSYRLPLEGKFHVELLAGARIWNVSEELSYQSGTLTGFNVSGDKTWVNPAVGADLRYDLGKRWSLIAKGFVGGTGSDLGWEVMGAVAYRFTDWCSAAAGYRFLREDYSNDGFNFNTDVKGFILGVGFHF